MVLIIHMLGAGILGLILGISFSFLGNILFNRRVRQRAVERNLGHFDSQTGKFVWSNSDAEYLWNGSESEEEVESNNRTLKIFKSGNESARVFKMYRNDGQEIVNE